MEGEEAEKHGASIKKKQFVQGRAKKHEIKSADKRQQWNMIPELQKPFGDVEKMEQENRNLSNLNSYICSILD